MWAILLALILYGLGCYYIGLRFIGWIRLLFPATISWLIWTLYGVFLLLTLGSFFIKNKKIARPLQQIGGIWVAVFFYSLIANGLVDLARLVSRIPGGGVPLFDQPSVGGGSVVVLTVFLLIVFGLLHARRIRTKTYQIQSSVAPTDGLRIAMVSDIHLGYMNGTKKARKIVAAINALDADMVCIVGDIFDGDYSAVRDIGGVEAAFRDLNSRFGVFAAFGNHDQDSPTGEMAQFLQRAGITLLFDAYVTLPNGTTLVGRRDASPLAKTPRPGRVGLDALDYRREDFVVVLDHQPRVYAAKEAAEQGADLMLSGHTHRGQLFPFTLLVAAVFPNYYGLTTLGDLKLIVSSGVSTWGPPMRIGSSSEVVMVEMTRSARPQP